ncbi:ABC transporter permease [Flavitalea sp. BT771]|uniref:ABC transporter permease n=1 Tax=Flavitalea sp. BT771 TaxID=3063329 RepID=UPI0026E18B47|nr:ABC transporter permease [Flavitalea sp. BT771]MDO6432665.1 ABC transporter permease [Flavitalea sp. BT771]MDV6222059.1 FtsX-like permease family protein [Flavitalea sp. BT771]
MLKNYLTIAWRNLLKNKLFSSINIIGLALGMAIALLIGLWIADELQFDHYYQRHDRLARAAVLPYIHKDTIYTNLTIQMPLGNELRTKYGKDLKYVSLVASGGTHILATSEKKVSGTAIYAEKDFPEMFTLDMVRGGRDVLKDPTTCMISQSMALAIFGHADPINKAILIDNEVQLKVGAVYKDLPENTTFYEMACIMPWENKANWWNSKDPQSNWYNHNGSLYVQVKDNVSMEQAAASVKEAPTSHIQGYTENATLFPLDKLHLYNEFTNGKMSGGRIQTVWLFGIIGIFVLLLACINFMNLSTARSERRAKEVGIRKAIGSLRTQLIAQFISESLAVSFLSLGLALLLVVISLPFFNGLADKHTSLPWGNGRFWVLLLTFTFLTGLIAGSYPAFYLSAFKPIKVLKGTFRVGRLAAIPRKVLVVVQFTVSVTLIIGTIIVFRQIKYAKDRPVGYDREGLIAVDMNTDDLHKHDEAIRTALLQSGAVMDMGESNSLPTEISSGNGGFYWKGVGPDNSYNFGTLNVNYDYGHTVGWRVVEGRDFSRNFPGDTASVMGGLIVNESAVKQMGLKHPVGEIVNYKGTIFANVPHVIVGVVKDMVMESPYDKPAPVMFFCGGWVGNMVIRVNPTMPMREALTKIEPVFKKYNPGSPFDFKFIDDIYAKKFAAEERVGHLAAFFAVLAVFISCLGLFGLASFMAEQRVKEIGVRKVLGATVFNLWTMLSKDFVMLVILSCCISIPLAWYFLHAWLAKYDYRTALSWWVFVATGGGALFITLLTVSFQSVKAAIANPVKSLRTE